MTEIRKENLALFERHSEAWPIILILDRLEEPLREMSERARVLMEYGETRFFGVALHLISGVDDDTPSEEDSRIWLLERITKFHQFGASFEPLVNVDLANALGAPDTEADPVAIESFCTRILLLLKNCIQLEDEILNKRLHPELAELQFAFAGLTSDFIDPHVALVKRIRDFVENENATTFDFTLKISTDRLSRDLREDSPRPVPIAPPPKTSTASNIMGGCLLLLAAGIFGLTAPFSVALIVFLIFLWLRLGSK